MYHFVKSILGPIIVKIVGSLKGRSKCFDLNCCTAK